MPGFAFPPVGPLGFGSPPSSVLCSAKTASAHLGRFAFAPGHDTLRADSGLCPSVSRSSSAAGPLATDAGAFGKPAPLVFRLFRKETVGSPEFPSHPCEHMPRSQTPVVTDDLANDNRSPVCRLPVRPHRRRSALRYCHRTYPIDHDYTLFGAQSRGLRPHRSLCFAHPVSGIALRVGCRPAG
jgi:hypothetical protein